MAAAAQGRLPSWTVAGEARRAHMGRVAELLGQWAVLLDLGPQSVDRWIAVGQLHDVLREASPVELARKVPPGVASLPAPLLHGPAAAERLRIEGVLDGEALYAIAYHTTGHASLGVLGRALYVADFLEPGRTLEQEWRASLRARMPHDLKGVTRDVVAGRISHIVGRGVDLLPDTVRFWNALVATDEG